MREALSALTTRGRAFLAAGITVALCAAVLGFDALLRVGEAAGSDDLILVTGSLYVVGEARRRLGVSARADR